MSTLVNMTLLQRNQSPRRKDYDLDLKCLRSQKKTTIGRDFSKHLSRRSNPKTLQYLIQSLKAHRQLLGTDRVMSRPIKNQSKREYPHSPGQCRQSHMKSHCAIQQLLVKEHGILHPLMANLDKGQRATIHMQGHHLQSRDTENPHLSTKNQCRYKNPSLSSRSSGNSHTFLRRGVRYMEVVQ